jgi:hypothetical protein
MYIADILYFLVHLKELHYLNTYLDIYTHVESVTGFYITFYKSRESYYA